VQPCSTCLNSKGGQSGNIGQGCQQQIGQNRQFAQGGQAGQSGQGNRPTDEQRNWNDLQQDWNARGQGQQRQQQYQSWRNSGSRGTLWRRP